MLIEHLKEELEASLESHLDEVRSHVQYGGYFNNLDMNNLTEEDLDYYDFQVFIGDAKDPDTFELQVSNLFKTPKSIEEIFAFVETLPKEHVGVAMIALMQLQNYIAQKGRNNQLVIGE